VQKTTDLAVIFDMDGVLFDSEPVIETAAIRGLAEFGVRAKPGDFIPFIGSGEISYIGGVSSKYGVPYRPEMKDRVYEIYLDIVDDTLRVYDGAKDCLDNLRADNIPIALASAADRIKIDANLRVAGISLDTFKVILSAEDVRHKKPSPEIYLKTSGKLGIAPDGCVVVEDAINGIKSAKAAGMRCIAVTTTFPGETLEKEQPDHIRENLDEVYRLICNLRKGTAES